MMVISVFWIVFVRLIVQKLFSREQIRMMVLLISIVLRCFILNWLEKVLVVVLNWVVIQKIKQKMMKVVVVQVIVCCIGLLRFVIRKLVSVICFWVLVFVCRCGLNSSQMVIQLFQIFGIIYRVDRLLVYINLVNLISIQVEDVEVVQDSLEIQGFSFCLVMRKLFLFFECCDVQMLMLISSSLYNISVIRMVVECLDMVFFFVMSYIVFLGQCKLYIRFVFVI